MVLDAGGEVVTVAPDGSGRARLSGVAGPGRRHLQPTWSPDGERVVWSTVARTDTGTAASLVSARADGTDRWTVSLTFPSFYAYWRPGAEAVAFLTNGPLGLELGLADRHDGVRLLARGAPLFYDWSPGGDVLCAHVGADRLELVGADGRPEPLGPRPGAFSAPAWLDDDALVVATADDGQALDVVDRRGARRRRLARFGDAVRFAASPDGTRLAYVAPSREPPRRTTGSLEEAIPDHLVVVGPATGELDVVLASVPVAFEWSPDGSALLVLAPEAEDGGVALRWRVWRDTGEPARLGRFVPSFTYARDYLPFAEQYARSQTAWSPDGRAFCFAGRPDGGEEGVWVQRLGQPEPTFVCPGAAVSWSPPGRPA